MAEYYINADGQIYTGDLIDGDRLATQEEIDAHFNPPLTLEEIQKKFTAAIQARLDGFAQTRGYDDIHTAASYAISTVPTFKAEGQYALEARDQTWIKAYEILGAVTAGERPMPTLDEVFSELPVLAWPDAAAA